MPVTAESNDPARSGRLESTTLDDSTLSEYAVITHPFHPMKGVKLPVIKSRKLANKEVLCLRGSREGTLNVPRDWTDMALPDPYATLPTRQILSYEKLCDLLGVISRINSNSQNRKNKK